MRIQSHWTRMILVFALAFLTVAGFTGTGFSQQSNGQSNGTIRDLKQDLEAARQAKLAQQARAARLEAELSKLGGIEAKLNASIGNLNANIGKLENARADVASKRDQTESDIATNEQQAAELQQTILRQKRDVQNLMIVLDRERSSRYVKLLARAESIYDLLSKARDVGTLGNQDIGVIDDLNNNVRALNEKKVQYQSLVLSLNSYDRDLIGKQDSLKKIRLELTGQIARLQQTQSGKAALRDSAIVASAQASERANGLIGQIVLERRRLQREYERKLAEERRQRALEAQRIAAIQDQQRRAEAQRVENTRQENATPTRPRGAALPASLNGRFVQPVSGGVIIQEFGGQDYMTIRARNIGDGVFAVAAGEVIVSDFQQSNTGWSVAVQHTNSLVTYYSNLQDAGRPAVGARVARGQQIGNVGGGLILPQDELGFKVIEISDNGTEIPVNPRRYFR
jgi:murein DD-endopeptidase MepM/ murein hydrolase activator NlpD